MTSEQAGKISRIQWFAQYLEFTLTRAEFTEIGCAVHDTSSEFLRKLVYYTVETEEYPISYIQCNIGYNTQLGIKLRKMFIFPGRYQFLCVINIFLSLPFAAIQLFSINTTALFEYFYSVPSQFLDSTSPSYVVCLGFFQ